MKPTGQKSLTQTGISDGFSAQKTYSVKELAEMVNSHSAELYNVDVGACTNWYRNMDFIEEWVSYVEHETDIDMLIRFILLKQKHQAFVEKNPKVCCRVPDARKYAPYVDDLSEQLSAIRTRELQKREIEASLEEMKKTWSMTPPPAPETSSSAVPLAKPTHTEASETLMPQFTDEAVDYHLADLPAEIQEQILLPDDKTYSEFVTTLKGPVNDWVGKNKLQHWNIVRFICRLRGIVAKKCSLRIFGLFLESIGLGNQESNMKQFKEANDDAALIKYDNPPSGFDGGMWKIRKPGKEVEELLSETIKTVAA